MILHLYRGVIYSLTLKAHKPRNNCQQGCYAVKTKIWGNKFESDDAQLAVIVVHIYLKWAAQVRNGWKLVVLSHQWYLNTI